jgi:hypothetical protein
MMLFCSCRARKKAQLQEQRRNTGVSPLRFASVEMTCFWNGLTCFGRDDVLYGALIESFLGYLILIQLLRKVEIDGISDDEESAALRPDVDSEPMPLAVTLIVEAPCLLVLVCSGCIE